MAKYLAVVKNLPKFRAIKIEQVGSDLNSHSDALAGLESVFERETKWTIAIDLISAPNHEVSQESILVNTELGLRWMDPIVNFLQHDKLPEDKREVHKLRVKAVRFWITLLGTCTKDHIWGSTCCVSILA